MCLTAFLIGLTVLLSSSSEATTGEHLYVNFGSCSCNPSWVCPDGHRTLHYSGHQLGFENPYALRGKRKRLCKGVAEEWKTLVHFSSMNKFCISNIDNGLYFYEIVLGDCRFNTYNMLSVNGGDTLTHYQSNNTPKLFTGTVKVSKSKLCFWDPRKPIANKGTILEVVDGCGYPQPTRVPLIKLIQVSEEKKDPNAGNIPIPIPVTPTVKCEDDSCPNGKCSVVDNKITCACGDDSCPNGKCSVVDNKITCACGDDSCPNGKCSVVDNKITCACGDDSCTNGKCSVVNNKITCACGDDSCPNGKCSVVNNKITCACGDDSCPNGKCSVVDNKITCACGDDSCPNGKCSVVDNKITCACGDDSCTNGKCSVVDNKITCACGDDSCTNGKCVVVGNVATCACADDSCVNGECKIVSNKATCTCKTGWFGDKCDVQCNASNTCGDNGTCKSTTLGGKIVKLCSCNKGAFGTHCESTCSESDESGKCEHGACTADKQGSKSCVCEEGWSGALCNVATAVIVREEKVWVLLAGRKVCLTLRKESGKWRYYTHNKGTGELESFVPPPGFRWQVFLDGETIVIRGKETPPTAKTKSHRVKVTIHGKSETILLKLQKGKWKPYVRGPHGAWVCFHPPPGFSLTVKIGGDIIRIRPEATYHKIRLYEGARQRPLYLMRVGDEWAPFYHSRGALRSYHPPAHHSAVVHIGGEVVHITHHKPCAGNPCLNHGRCTDEGVSFSCACDSRWSGARCEIPRRDSPCQADTCGPHGTCVELEPGTVQCRCARGWSGFRCSLPTSCPPLSCSNGGIMVPLGGRPHCQCPVGFTGRCCEKQVSVCSRDPCNKRGLCEQVGESYACHCHAPYTGRHCTIVRKAMVCRVGTQIFNVGQVVEEHCNRCVCLEDGHFVCTTRSCRAPHFVSPRHVKELVFEGHLCGRNPCVHGQCSSVHFRPRCRCQDGYTGPTCEIELTVRQITPVSQYIIHRQQPAPQPRVVEVHHPAPPPRVVEVHHPAPPPRVVHHRPVIVHHHPPPPPVAVVQHEPAPPVEVHHHHHHHHRTVQAPVQVDVTEVHEEAPVIQETVHVHSPCSRVRCGHGSCNLIRNSPHCICRAGWQGAYCHQRVAVRTSPCQQHACSNGGSCILHNASPSCLCPAQFSGSHCERDVGYSWSLR